MGDCLRCFEIFISLVNGAAGFFETSPAKDRAGVTNMPTKYQLNTPFPLRLGEEWNSGYLTG